MGFCICIRLQKIKHKFCVAIEIQSTTGWTQTKQTNNYKLPPDQVCLVFADSYTFGGKCV